MTTFALRDYQQANITELMEAVDQGNHPLCVMATGLGKTVVFCELARLAHGRYRKILIVANRVHLVQQAQRSLSRHCGEDIGIEQGENREKSRGSLFQRRVVVCSVASLSSPRRLQQWDPDEVDLIVVDEAHRVRSTTFERVIGYFQRNPRLRVIGFTATPNRHDGKPLAKIFNTVVGNQDLRWGIDNGWLAPVRCGFVRVHGLEFEARSDNKDLTDADVDRAWGISGDEASEGELAATAESQRKLYEVVCSASQHAGNRSGIVFCASVAHAQAMVNVFRREGHTAASITQDTPYAERESILLRYSRREIQWLVGCLVFAEGFDAPVAEVVVIARPTKSEVLYRQFVGRVTRPAAEIAATLSACESPDARRTAIARSSKPHCLVLDCVGVTGSMSLLTAADVLGDGTRSDFRDQVLRELAETGNEYDPGQAAGEMQQRQAARHAEMQAEEEERKERDAKAVVTEWLRRAEEYRLRRLRGKVDSTLEIRDPFERGDHRPDLMSSKVGSATESQIGMLAKLGVTRGESERMSQAGASRRLAELMKRTGGEYIITRKPVEGVPVKRAPAWFRKWLETKRATVPWAGQILKHFEQYDKEKQ